MFAAHKVVSTPSGLNTDFREDFAEIPLQFDPVFPVAACFHSQPPSDLSMNISMNFN